MRTTFVHTYGSQFCHLHKLHFIGKFVILTQMQKLASDGLLVLDLVRSQIIAVPTYEVVIAVGIFVLSSCFFFLLKSPLFGTYPPRKF